MVLIVLHMIPIWGFKYFPSQDGPLHLENANIIHDYYDQCQTILHKYYHLNNNLVPNSFGHFVMAGLMIMMPVLIVEKILLTGYVIFLPLSVRYTLEAIRPGSSFLAVLSIPFVYNHLFQMGFYNFSYSLPIFIFTIGYWIKNRERFTIRNTIALMMLTILLYLTHLISIVLAFLTIGFFLIWPVLLDLIPQIRWRQFDLFFLWNAFRSSALMAFFAFLPALILVVKFLIQRGMEMTTTTLSVEWLPRLHHLLRLDSLVSYREMDVWLAKALICVFMLIIVYLVILKYLTRQVNCWDGLLFILAGCVYLYFSMPDEVSWVGYVFMSHRMSLYIFLILILWFGAMSYGRLTRLGIQLVTAGIAVTMLGFYTTKYAELNDYLEEYLSGMHLIETNTTLLPLSFSPYGRDAHGRRLSLRIAPFAQASGYIAAQRDIVDLNNIEGNTGVHPIVYNPLVNPNYIGDIESVPPCVDFLTYNHQTEGKVDYVLVWGVHNKLLDYKCTKSIFRQLEEGYELIYTSPKRGLMQLYRRKNFREVLLPRN